MENVRTYSSTMEHLGYVLGGGKTSCHVQRPKELLKMVIHSEFLPVRMVVFHGYGSFTRRYSERVSMWQWAIIVVLMVGIRHSKCWLWVSFLALEASTWVVICLANIVVFQPPNMAGVCSFGGVWAPRALWPWTNANHVYFLDRHRIFLMSIPSKTSQSKAKRKHDVTRHL